MVGFLAAPPPPQFPFNPFGLRGGGACLHGNKAASIPRDPGRHSNGRAGTLPTPVGAVSPGTVPPWKRASGCSVLARGGLRPRLWIPGEGDKEVGNPDAMPLLVLPDLFPPPSLGSGVGPSGRNMWAPNPAPRLAHRPLGARPAALPTLPPRPAACAGILQTGGRGPGKKGHPQRH